MDSNHEFCTNNEGFYIENDEFCRPSAACSPRQGTRNPHHNVIPTGTDILPDSACGLQDQHDAMFDEIDTDGSGDVDSGEIFH